MIRTTILLLGILLCGCATRQPEPVAESRALPLESPEYITLKWDWNPEFAEPPSPIEQLVEFAVYSGTNGTNLTLVERTDLRQAVVSGLEQGRRYFFTVTAIKDGLESEKPTPIFYDVPTNRAAFSRFGNVSLVQSASGTRIRTVAKDGVVHYEDDAQAEPRTLPGDPWTTFDGNRLTLWVQGQANERDSYSWQFDNTGQPSKKWIGGVFNMQNPAVVGADANIAEAWTHVQYTGALVGLIDSGINTHDDLLGVVTNGLSADPTGHGTCIAGIIGANANSIGIAGASKGASIVFAPSPNFTLSQILAGFDLLIPLQPRVINCSWGFTLNDSPALRAACEAAQDAGILLVCAALNQAVDYNSRTNDLPLQFKWSPTRTNGLQNIVGVTAMMPDGLLLGGGAAWGSDWIDFGAPSWAIPGTSTNGTNYVYMNGTSAGAAVATGVAALVAAAHPDESPAHWAARMRYTCRPASGLMGQTRGKGTLDAEAAITMQWPSLSIAGHSIEISNLRTNMPYWFQQSSNLVTWTSTEFVPAASPFTVNVTEGFYRVAFLP